MVSGKIPLRSSFIVPTVASMVKSEGGNVTDRLVDAITGTSDGEVAVILEVSGGTEWISLAGKGLVATLVISCAESSRPQVGSVVYCNV